MQGNSSYNQNPPRVDITLDFEEYDEMHQEQNEDDIGNKNIGSNSKSITQQQSRNRSFSSNVWQYFVKREDIGKVQCNLCKQFYAHKKNSGMGTLKRHIEWHERKSGNLKQQQTQLGSVGGKLVDNLNIVKIK